MAIEIIIFVALVEMTILAWHINARALNQAVIGQRVQDHVLRDTATARYPQALRGFMKITPRTAPRIAVHVPHAHPWPDMAQSIADDLHISFNN